MNNKQLIPTNEINEEFEAILVENDSIAHCEIHLKNGTIKNKQQLNTRYDEFALDTVNNEFCFSLKDKNSINFHRINLQTFSQINAVTLNLYNYFSSEELKDESYYSKLIYLNHQYLLYFISKREMNYGHPFYQCIFLVNTSTGEIKRLSPLLPNGDNLLRLDTSKNIYLSNHNHLLLLKTGRIRPFEKQSMYKNVDIENPYHDHLESIYLMKVSSLIDQQNFNNATLISLLNYSGASEKLLYENNILSYVVSDFTNNTKELIKHDLLKGDVSKFLDDQLIRDHLNDEFEILPSYYYYISKLSKQEKSDTFNLIDDELSFNVKLDEISGENFNLL
ncbi:hypothetical protein JIN86_10320 [Lysinibacillus sp. HST-98]|uniref:hypothetical protein n=1 Tax=Lysinibacillus TaxID=400634 RepID=UPI001925A602|nr:MULTISPECIES: hypothetical protein [Lysinibacillus]MBL3729998.1 hypothetical protein [Lysinibacillus sp. HST-98]MBU5251229.1 hypothetical protein [Lysinibacillus capsici]